MTISPDELRRELRRVLPDCYRVFEPYPDGSIEVFGEWWTDDGDGINVTVLMTEDGLEVTEDGWVASRRLHWQEDPISDRTMERVAEIAGRAGAQADHLRVFMPGLMLTEIPEAVSRMAWVILEITRLRPTEDVAESAAAQPVAAAD